ncbi:uncharacterized protein TERG_00874 [Trichophyton rubrum CBS 118892]|uniref:Uncharacterized protein n=1 Tax=Trichophyton rubrum (strain ATCC MYA-4607 / CBS 118892) TaxID=559305 RepID=F2SDR8_TRIRC|nr:uncharacterized protein TERG_00874 [Trichophyton rubrum CBS 118892]EGD84596.2 hypothetical protein TERG_00874 [Trichophyton rubrum CBS 118892]
MSNARLPIALQRQLRTPVDTAEPDAGYEGVTISRGSARVRGRHTPTQPIVQREGEERLLTTTTERTTQLREVPVRGVQEASSEDGRAAGGQGRCTKQLDSPAQSMR